MGEGLSREPKREVVRRTRARPRGTRPCWRVSSVMMRSASPSLWCAARSPCRGRGHPLVCRVRRRYGGGDASLSSTRPPGSTAARSSRFGVQPPLHGRPRPHERAFGSSSARVTRVRHRPQRVEGMADDQRRHPDPAALLRRRGGASGRARAASRPALRPLVARVEATPPRTARSRAGPAASADAARRPTGEGRGREQQWTEDHDAGLHAVVEDRRLDDQAPDAVGLDGRHLQRDDVGTERDPRRSRPGAHRGGPAALTTCSANPGHRVGVRSSGGPSGRARAGRG